MKPFTIALIGPDGAGKTTLARRLPESLPFRARYLYMGVNPDSSNRLLPTTRARRALRGLRGGGGRVVRPTDSRPPTGAYGPGRRGRLRAARSLVALANRLAEEAYRQVLAWRYRRAGEVVIFDRDFYADYYAYDIAAGPKTLARKLHGLLLARLYPRPDLYVYLDAPAAVLFARKGEGTLEGLERRRREYLELRAVVPCFEVVDATLAPEAALARVVDVVTGFARQRSASGTAA